jgi:hypothetical protein
MITTTTVPIFSIFVLMIILLNLLARGSDSFQTPPVTTYIYLAFQLLPSLGVRRPLSVVR